MGKEKYLEEINEFVSRLSEDFKVNNIIFFGSRAIGGAKQDSDIDLIIVSEDFEGMGFFERVSRMYDYWTLDMPVDFLCYTTKEFERLRKRISIVKDALENGIVVK